jgi:hypothetical protein
VDYSVRYEQNETGWFGNINPKRILNHLPLVPRVLLLNKEEKFGPAFLF